MALMVVTLEVSKLSGWSNADALCQHAVPGEVYRSALGRRRAAAVQAACRAGLDCRFGARHGEERTWNMEFMFVTPEVSQLEMSALKFFKL